MKIRLIIWAATRAMCAFGALSRFAYNAQCWSGRVAAKANLAQINRRRSSSYVHLWQQH